jgi:transposase
MTSRKIGIGKASAGGVRFDIVYTYDEGKSVDKSEATRVKIREIARKGNVIQETFGIINKRVIVMDTGLGL